MKRPLLLPERAELSLWAVAMNKHMVVCHKDRFHASFIPMLLVLVAWREE
jgi:hypothetical protein